MFGEGSPVWHTPDGTPASAQGGAGTGIYDETPSIPPAKRVLGNSWSLESSVRSKAASRVSPDITTASGTPVCTTPSDQWNYASSSGEHQCALWVCIESAGFRYRLTADDVQTVFLRFGKVLETSVSPDGLSAIVTFASMSTALTAIQSLHGKQLRGIPGHLSVTCAPQAHTEASEVPEGFSRFNTPQHPSKNTLSPYLCLPPLSRPGDSSFISPPPFFSNRAHDTPNGSENVTTRTAVVDPTAPCNLVPQSHPGNLMPDGRAIRKYTARFDIGIENDSEFQVARRIIGPRGINMKKIVRLSDAKLRLRGKGSGFLEGVMRQESPEALHLCISCRMYSGYKIAIKMCAELLLSIYSDYYTFCQQKNRPCEELTIQLREVPLISRSLSPSEDSGWAGEGDEAASLEAPWKRNVSWTPFSSSSTAIPENLGH